MFTMLSRKTVRGKMKLGELKLIKNNKEVQINQEVLKASKNDHNNRKVLQLIWKQRFAKSILKFVLLQLCVSSDQWKNTVY